MITKSDKVNLFDRIRVDPERSRRIKRIVFIPLEVASPRSFGLALSARARLLTGCIAIIVLLLLAFILPLPPHQILVWGFSGWLLKV